MSGHPRIVTQDHGFHDPQPWPPRIVILNHSLANKTHTKPDITSPCRLYPDSRVNDIKPTLVPLTYRGSQGNRGNCIAAIIRTRSHRPPPPPETRAYSCLPRYSWTFIKPTINATTFKTSSIIETPAPLIQSSHSSSTLSSLSLTPAHLSCCLCSSFAHLSRLRENLLLLRISQSKFSHSKFYHCNPSSPFPPILLLFSFRFLCFASNLSHDSRSSSSLSSISRIYLASLSPVHSP
jgi:hypothetical protein